MLPAKGNTLYLYSDTDSQGSKSVITDKMDVTALCMKIILLDSDCPAEFLLQAFDQRSYSCHVFRFF